MEGQEAIEESIKAPAVPSVDSSVVTESTEVSVLDQKKVSEIAIEMTDMGSSAQYQNDATDDSKKDTLEGVKVEAESGKLEAGKVDTPTATAVVVAVPGEEEIIPAYKRLSTIQRRGALASLMVAMFLAALDRNIVIVALPDITTSFKHPELLSWVLSSYMLTSSAFLALYGRFSDVYGRRWVYLLSVLVFVIGSCLCGASQSIWMLIISRGVQGVGGGGLMSLGMIIIGDIYSPEERPKMFAAISPMFAISSVLGPVIGGGFTDGIGWRWVFWINVPLGVLALVGGFFAMNYETKIEKMPLDVMGSLLIAGCTICMVLFVSWGGESNGYPWGSGVIIGLMIASFILLCLFIWQEFRHPLPILNIRLFGNRNFALIMIAMFMQGMLMLGAFAYMPVYFQNLKHDSATMSGFKLLPLMGGLLLCAGISSAIMSKTGKFTGLLPAGACFCMAGTGMMIRLAPDTTYGYIAGALFLIGVGMGLLFPVTTTIVQNSVTAADMANALSALNFFQSIGGAIGVAIVGTVLIQKETEHLLLTHDLAASLSYGLDNTFIISTCFGGVVLLAVLGVKPVALFIKGGAAVE